MRVFGGNDVGVLLQLKRDIVRFRGWCHANLYGRNWQQYQYVPANPYDRCLFSPHTISIYWTPLEDMHFFGLLSYETAECFVNPSL